MMPSSPAPSPVLRNRWLAWVALVVSLCSLHVAVLTTEPIDRSVKPIPRRVDVVFVTNRPGRMPQEMPRVTAELLLSVEQARRRFPQELERLPKIKPGLQMVVVAGDVVGPLLLPVDPLVVHP